ncbi:MAG: LysR family transcriptional regulator [Bdellovibrionaceae bacterium]|nr:LysR family transcriptional regulator [Pseudobdellovibrionaceae bacterium]
MNGPLNLQHLVTFCTVLTEGSMTAAGNKLSLTQPAVSQQIKSLEQQLGVRLLERGSKMVSPTVQAQLLFDYAKQILNLSHQAKAAMKTVSGNMSGDLRIATINSLGLYLVSPIIGLLLRNNPKLKINLMYGSYNQVVNSMRNGDVDVSILPDLRAEAGFELSQFQSQFLIEDDIWLVGSGKESMTKGAIEVAELSSRPMVVFSDLYPQFKVQLNKQLKSAQLQLNSVFTSDNVGTLKKVIESNMGWGFLPSHSIKKQVRTRRLNHILVKSLDYSTKLYMYHSVDNPNKEALKVLYLALKHQATSE